VQAQSDYHVRSVNVKVESQPAERTRTRSPSRTAIRLSRSRHPSQCRTLVVPLAGYDSCRVVRRPVRQLSPRQAYSLSSRAPSTASALERGSGASVTVSPVSRLRRLSRPRRRAPPPSMTIPWSAISAASSAPAPGSQTVAPLRGGRAGLAHSLGLLASDGRSVGAATEATTVAAGVEPPGVALRSTPDWSTSTCGAPARHYTRAG
jgi:hypothetical protein